MVAVLAMLGLVFLLTLLLGARLVRMEIGTGALFTATAGSVLLALLFGALGLALGCATGRRGTSVGVCASFALATYILHSYAPLVSPLEPYQVLSPFYQALGNDPLRSGLGVKGAAILVAAVVALAIAAVGAHRRRDVTV
jgi:ABC-2 type transport system permease protein